MSGWFVEVPTELKQEFERCYKGRSAKRKLTIAAIRWAISERPKLEPRRHVPKETEQLEN